MAGIMHNIEEKFKGGKKEGEKHDEYKGEGGHAQFVKPGHGYGEHGYGEHKPEHKEGLAEKINGKIHGVGGKEKKKKERKSKKHGHGHGDSSSSDSD